MQKLLSANISIW